MRNGSIARLSVATSSPFCFNVAVGLCTLQSQWQNFADAKERQGVLATSVPKATVLEFLESTEAPRDTFTILEFGDLWDVVVYQDPLLPHELGKEFATHILHGICNEHGVYMSPCHLLLVTSCTKYYASAVQASSD